MKWILFAIAWVVGAFLHYWTTEAVSIALFGLLLLARAIKFVFCDSTVAVFF